MDAITGSSRTALLGFFLSHIPITMLMDGQASLFRLPYPKAMTDFTQLYASTLQDPHFLGKGPSFQQWFSPWFSAMITWELIFKLPYFFVAVHMLLSNKKGNNGSDNDKNGVPHQYPEWFRLWSIFYGASTATTLVPVLGVVWWNDADAATPLLKVLLSLVYLPYLIFPLLMVKECWEPSATTGTQKTSSTSSIVFRPMSGITYLSFLMYYATHIPVSIFLDGQIIFPPLWFPQPVRDLLSFYSTTFQDPLMTGPPYQDWFRAMAVLEVFWLVPFFVVAIRVMTSTTKEQQQHAHWPLWFHSLSLCYAANQVTTLLAIYATALDAGVSVHVLGFYTPYLLVPLWLTWYCVQPESLIVVESSKVDDKKKDK